MEETQRVFDVGDIISDVKKNNIRVIMGFSESEKEYSFMELNTRSVKALCGTEIGPKKGGISKQPYFMVHKYFALIEI